MCGSIGIIMRSVDFLGNDRNIQGVPGHRSGSAWCVSQTSSTRNSGAKVSSVPWAVEFPNGGPFPRHPSQIYEALPEGLVLFVILRILTHSQLKLKAPGFVGGTFVAAYGVSHIFVEFFREPDVQLGYLLGGWLTMAWFCHCSWCLSASGRWQRQDLLPKSRPISHFPLDRVTRMTFGSSSKLARQKVLCFQHANPSSKRAG